MAASCILNAVILVRHGPDLPITSVAFARGENLRGWKVPDPT